MCIYTYSPIPNVYPYTPVPCIPTPTYTWTTYVACNHCWCQDALNKLNHVQCCKCFDTMDDRYVPERRAERRDREVAAIIAGAVTDPDGPENATNDHSECRCVHNVPMGKNCTRCPVRCMHGILLGKNCSLCPEN
jgi:hypothetical protein